MNHLSSPYLYHSNHLLYAYKRFHTYILTDSWVDESHSLNPDNRENMFLYSPWQETQIIVSEFLLGRQWGKGPSGTHDSLCLRKKRLLSPPLTINITMLWNITKELSKKPVFFFFHFNTGWLKSCTNTLTWSLKRQESQRQPTCTFYKTSSDIRYVSKFRTGTLNSFPIF